MTQRRSMAGRAITRAIFALAALIFSLGASVDSLAHSASVAVEAGHASLVVKLISAFDVIEDGLDQLPGKAVHDQQQLPIASFSFDEPIALTQPAPVRSAWSLPVVSPLVSRSPERLDRPPRT